jgi:hypothetical protein
MLLVCGDKFYVCIVFVLHLYAVIIVFMLYKASLWAGLGLDCIIRLALWLHRCLDLKYVYLVYFNAVAIGSKLPTATALKSA